MTRYFLLRKGRVIASDTGTAYLEGLAGPSDLLISEQDWKETHYRRALLAYEAGRRG